MPTDDQTLDAFEHHVPNADQQSRIQQNIGNMHGLPVLLERPCVEMDRIGSRGGNVNCTHRTRRVLESVLGRKLLGRAGNEYCLHKCNNRFCIEPTHLYAGTAQDNVRDSVLAGTNHCLDRHAASVQARQRVLRGKCNLTSGVLHQRRWARWRRNNGRPAQPGDAELLNEAS